MEMTLEGKPVMYITHPNSPQGAGEAFINKDV